MGRFCRLLLTVRSFTILRTSPSIVYSDFPKFLSTLAKDDCSNLNLHNSGNPPKNLFAEFAAKKFKLASADIARMLRACPLLKKLKTLERAEQVVDMLKRYGCSKQQIALIIKRQPKVLVISTEDIMEPKIRLLKGFGIRGDGLANLLTLRPTVLTISLEHTLRPNMQFLKKIFIAEKWLRKALSRNPYIVVQNLEKTLKPSVAFWEEFGFRGEELLQLLLKSPGLLRCTCLKPEKVDLIRRIGVERGSKMYIYVLIVVATGRIETLEGKIKNYRQCGLTVEETMQLFRASPYAFGLSKEKVKQIMDFVVNEMELPANTVVKYPAFLKKSLDKTLKPRFSVWQKVKSMGGNTIVKPIHTTMLMNEGCFFSNVVMGHPESKFLYAFYQEALAAGYSPTDISKNP